MKAAIMGGTGLTGSILLRRLLSDPVIEKVVSVSRRPSGLVTAKLEDCLIPELDALHSQEAQLKADLYFNCLGTTIRKAGTRAAFREVDYDAALEFARIAKSHEATAFVSISAMGANEDSNFFYNRVKGELDRDLQTLDLRSLAIFRPALLIGERDEVRRAERAFVTLAKPILKVLPSHIGRQIATDVERLADRMIEVAKAPRRIQIIEARDI